MAINFPTSPTLNDTYTYNGNVWIWDGTSWLSSNGTLSPMDIVTNANASYTLTLSDANDHIRSTSSSATTITVPPNSSVAFQIGTNINIFRAGTGTVTLAEGAGVTITSKNSYKQIDGQYASALLIKTGTDTWDLVGALTA